MAMKGAPERIWARCNRVLLNGEVVDMTEEHAARIETGNMLLGKQGERVLGMCYKPLDEKKYPAGFEFEEDEPYNGILEGSDMIFVGLMALIDPPREAVPQAVKDCQTGGIQVIMVTGDHAITAKAIAQNIGIINDKTAEDIAEEQGVDWKALSDEDKWAKVAEAPACVVTGEQVLKLVGKVKQDPPLPAAQAEFGRKTLKMILEHDQIVCARTSPAQKLQIVEACQSRGKIVAVTGDGVNDSPALKQADIGVAMGIAGSAVAKEAADMILLNDDFASIVQGVEEGRLVFDNLKKSIAYTLTSNIPEISPYLIYILASVPLPLSVVMILAIDLGTDMYPAISMAYEKAESDIMRRRPRDPQSDNLVTLKLLSYTYLQIGIIQASAGFFCYFVVFSDCGFWPGDLFGLRNQWNDKDLFVEDSYGNEWNYNSRLVIEESAQTSYFISIIIVQWADLIICKTRFLSLFQQGMRNYDMNCALVFETLLGVCICYIPGMYKALKTRPLNFVWWLPALTFSILIFIYDELRKYVIRYDRKRLGHDRGFLERMTYY
jgi:sodium/potassium-transporting ATPase subunit alpha